MRWLLLAVSLTAPVARAADPPPGASRVAAADVDQAAAAARLSGRTLEALDAILGPGRAKVLVEVRGERYRLRTETEMITPLDPGLFDSAGSSPDSGPLVRILDLPGYSKGKKLDPVLPGALTGGLREEKEKAQEEEKKAEPLYTQREHEQSERDGGFEIKQVMAQVVIDAAVPEERAREASQLLPTLLMIDGSRGDTLAISRAAFQPAWKGAFSDPASLRRAAYAGAAVLTALLVVLIAGASFVRAARVFATELGRRRTEELEGGAAEPLPELVPGAPGGFLDADAEGGAEAAPGAPAALGRRFDFLADREPAHCAHALAGERPEDAAMVFGHIASSMPEVASRAFALLPPDFQAEVSSRLLKLRVADPERLAEIEERLKRAVEHGLQGSERLGRILSRVPLDTRSDLLGRLTLRDHEGAAEVERHLFTIEDLETLSPVELRRLIGAVPYEAWGFALRGTPQGVIDRVLAELPEGPRELVRDLLSSPQPRDKVLEARSKVLDARGELAAKGEIKLGEREAGSELL